jgi:hypothetical protein
VRRKFEEEYEESIKKAEGEKAPGNSWTYEMLMDSSGFSKENFPTLMLQ